MLYQPDQVEKVGAWHHPPEQRAVVTSRGQAQAELIEKILRNHIVDCQLDAEAVAVPALQVWASFPRSVSPHIGVVMQESGAAFPLHTHRMTCMNENPARTRAALTSAS